MSIQRYLAFNIPCMAQPWLTYIGCITIINIINMYRHDTFLHSSIHMVWGLLPVPIHGICHKQILTCMGRTYTLDMTNLVGPCRRLQHLLTNFCYGLVALSLSPEGCWSHSSASTTYSSGSMSSLVLPLMPTSKKLLPLVVHTKHIFIHFKHKT